MTARRIALVAALGVATVSLGLGLPGWVRSQSAGAQQESTDVDGPGCTLSCSPPGSPGKALRWAIMAIRTEPR